MGIKLCARAVSGLAIACALLTSCTAPFQTERGATVAGAGEAAEDRAPSRTEYTTEMARLCASHFVYIERPAIKVSFEQYRRMEQANMEKLEDFVEEAKSVTPPADLLEHHAKLLSGTSELIDATEVVMDVPPRAPAEYFAAETVRAETAEQLWFATDFSDLPLDCNWQDEFSVLNDRFFARANETCFHFYSDVSLMFEQEVDTLERDGRAFGPGFSREFQQRLERMVADMNRGIPGPLVDGPVSEMLAMYSQAASSLGTIRSAVRRGDRETVVSKLDYYFEVIERANRIAKRFKLLYCVATVTPEGKPEPKPKVV